MNGLSPTPTVERAPEPQKSEPMETFVTQKGLVIRIKRVPPLILQRVVAGLPLPQRPVYEAKTISGRVELHPLDEQSAKETPGGEAQWEYYQTELRSIQARQNEVVTRAAFLYGTECEIPEDGWDEIQEFLGVTVPKHPDMRRAHYLTTQLDVEDLTTLLQKIMAKVNLPEEVVAEAESSFSSPLPAQPARSEPLQIPGRNTPGDVW